MTARDLAERLDRAAREQAPIEPIAGELPDTAAAYRIQRELRQLRLARGERHFGWKLGFTSAAKRAQMGVHEPVYGFLTDAMLVTRLPLSLSGLIAPRAEPEIAIKLASPLAGQVTREEVLEATAEVRAAIEVLDSRFLAFKFGLLDVVADNTSAAMVLLGPQADSADQDWAAERVQLEIDGEVRASAHGAAVMGHPAEAVRWLASKTPLSSGDWILTGGLTEAMPLRGIGELRARYSTLGELALPIAE